MHTCTCVSPHPSPLPLPLPLPRHSELYLADVAGALFISFLICATMLPLSIYSAKILLQVSLSFSEMLYG